MFTGHDNELRAIADLALASIADQLLVPQSHHVDVLLDLFGAAHDPIVRSTITDRLSELRFVRMVAADEVRADLDAIVTMSAIDCTDAMAWAERAFECECAECLAAIDTRGTQRAQQTVFTRD